jgi:hypothetical protein
MTMKRRAFIQATAISGVGALIVAKGAVVKGYTANEKLNVALVGVGGRGQVFVDTIPEYDNVVAMCDCDDQKAASSFNRLPDVPKFRDFRRMLDQMGDQIDAVTIGVPDHNHAVISAAFMKAGKHVYCEKPLTRSVHEARRLRELCHEHRVVTQMGNQGTAAEAFRRAVELLQSGVIGEVREVHGWKTGASASIVGGGAGNRELPSGEQSVPEHLDWDLWLGPAAWRPYHPDWLHWRLWRGLGTGQLGNWSVHTMNVVFRGLNLDRLWYQDGAETKPIKVYAEVSGIHHHTYPRREIVHFEIPEREGMPPVRVNWYNGHGEAPAPRTYLEEILERKLDWGDAGRENWSDHAGCLLIGTKGALHSNGHNVEMTLLPEEKFRGFEGPERYLPRSGNHIPEWLKACKGEGKPMSHFDFAGPQTEFALLGNIATLYPEGFEFDPMKMKIPGNDEADRCLHVDYRQGWTL